MTLQLREFRNEFVEYRGDVGNPGGLHRALPPADDICQRCKKQDANAHDRQSLNQYDLTNNEQISSMVCFTFAVAVTLLAKMQKARFLPDWVVM